MSALIDGGQQALGRVDDVRTPPRKGFAFYFDLLFIPVVLVCSLIALFAYVQGQTLDDIETRTLTADKIWTLVGQHLKLVAVSSVAVVALAVPIGILLTRPAIRRASAVVLPLANFGQAIPSIGVLTLFGIWFSFGFTYAVFALILVSFLSVLRNTIVGIDGLDPAYIDAARGMGLSRAEVLFRVELPLAVPVIMAGIRVALILNVGSAALATFTNAGGLGSMIETGLTLQRDPILITGAVLTACLALAIDWLAGLAERLLRPRGL
ncbi:ABC transporter permease [Solicola gregarius]|uniref:ABC transporter permease n=1 Tax=Solicola gregarius TaxID=2908642 RepID=A0AA46TLN4_9ACTN|nr:ABC transporter permease [Solicola gregarius]UYM07582.1 ABC transporter permease [Solicola gregarius]